MCFAHDRQILLHVRRTLHCKATSYCVSNTSFFFVYPLDKSEIHAIITKSSRHNRISGGVPEWPKGTDCKSAAFRFDGSNPSSPTTKNRYPQGWRFFVVEEWVDGFEDPKCDSPVDCRLPPARRWQHLYFHSTGMKMQTNPSSPTRKSPDASHQDFFNEICPSGK